MFCSSYQKAGELLGAPLLVLPRWASPDEAEEVHLHEAIIQNPTAMIAGLDVFCTASAILETVELTR